MDKILIIDSNETNIDLISKALYSERYDIYTATTGKIALAKVSVINPDLIIMDTDLPDLSGFDACKTLKSGSETKYIPVLLLITAETKDVILRSVYSEADDYILKLFNSTILLSKVKSLLRIKHLSDRIKTQYQELEEKNNLLNFQLKMARQVQSSIIKKIDASYGSLKILTEYLPALEIGGDFYNITSLDDNRIGVIIGDVSGHGISASLLTSMLSMMFKTLSPKYDLPSDLLKEMNTQFYHIFENADTQMYACMFYAIIDLKKNVLTYSNAGQAFPIYVNSIKNFEAAELELGGVPIGLMAEALYENISLTYNTNDLLFIHTDGLSDFFYKDKPDVFSEKLKNILSVNAKENPDNLQFILKNILDEFYFYDESKKFENDDISMIICKL